MDLTHVALFDARTLARLDRMAPIANVRERLGWWGGPSKLFEGALSVGLGWPLLLVVLGAFVCVRRRRDERSRPPAVTVQRVALVGVVLTIPVLVAAVIRLFWL